MLQCLIITSVIISTTPRVGNFQDMENVAKYPFIVKSYTVSLKKKQGKNLNVSHIKYYVHHWHGGVLRGTIDLRLKASKVILAGRFCRPDNINKMLGKKVQLMPFWRKYK